MTSLRHQTAEQSAHVQTPAWPPMDLVLDLYLGPPLLPRARGILRQVGGFRNWVSICISYWLLYFIPRTLPDNDGEKTSVLSLMSPPSCLQFHLCLQHTHYSALPSSPRLHLVLFLVMVSEVGAQQSSGRWIKRYLVNVIFLYFVIWEWLYLFIFVCS